MTEKYLLKMFFFDPKLSAIVKKQIIEGDIIEIMDHKVVKTKKGCALNIMEFRKISSVSKQIGNPRLLPESTLTKIH